MWEGGLRIYVELQTPSEALLGEQDRGSSEIRQERPKQGTGARGWLPLVHALANGPAPAVTVRLLPKPKLVPSRWTAGERVEVNSYLLAAFATLYKHESASEGSLGHFSCAQLFSWEFVHMFSRLGQVKFTVACHQLQ